MSTYETIHKTTGGPVNQLTAAGKAGGYLKDNRPKSVAQRKQQQSVATAPTTIQNKANTTGLPNNLKAGVENLLHT